MSGKNNTKLTFSLFLVIGYNNDIIKVYLIIITIIKDHNNDINVKNKLKVLKGISQETALLKNTCGSTCF